MAEPSAAAVQPINTRTVGQPTTTTATTIFKSPPIKNLRTSSLPLPARTVSSDSTFLQPTTIELPRSKSLPRPMTASESDSYVSPLLIGLPESVLSSPLVAGVKPRTSSKQSHIESQHELNDDEVNALVHITRKKSRGRRQTTLGSIEITEKRPNSPKQDNPTIAVEVSEKQPISPKQDTQGYHPAMATIAGLTLAGVVPTAIYHAIEPTQRLWANRPWLENSNTTLSTPSPPQIIIEEPATGLWARVFGAAKSLSSNVLSIAANHPWLTAVSALGAAAYWHARQQQQPDEYDTPLPTIYRDRVKRVPKVLSTRPTTQSTSKSSPPVKLRPKSVSTTPRRTRYVYYNRKT